MQVANTILQQLGGGRFITMTGAKNFVGSANSLRFRLRGGSFSNGINVVTITLTAMDDYIVEGLNVRGSNVKPVAYREGVYADTLRDVFTSMTGLQTSLGTMGR